MADDDPGYAARQKAHAERIKAERAVMDMTGLSRSDVRSLETFKRRLDVRDAIAKGSAVVAGPKPTMQIAESTIRGNGGGFSGDRAGAPNATAPTGVTIQVIVLANGILTYAQVPAVLGAPV